jgi:hypothetical protein
MVKPSIVVTYVNPNVGFSGASYRASNWSLFAYEAQLGYTYLDGIYTTRRQLKNKFGTDDHGILSTLLGDRYTVSQWPLEPLMLFAYSSNPLIRRALATRSIPTVRY